MFITPRGIADYHRNYRQDHHEAPTPEARRSMLHEPAYDADMVVVKEQTSSYGHLGLVQRSGSEDSVLSGTLSPALPALLLPSRHHATAPPLHTLPYRHHHLSPPSTSTPGTQIWWTS